MSAYLACRTLCCNQGTLLVAPSGVRTNIHLQQSNNHTSRTTSIQAFAASCTHARIHRHLLSYTAHAANVCTQSLVALFHVDVLGVAWGAENFGLTAVCVSKDNGEAQEGTLWQSNGVDISGHL